MIEQLFGSQTRVKLLKHFLDNPDQKYFVRELTRITDMLINSVRRELENLVDIGFLEIEVDAEHVDESVGKGKAKGLNVKKYYKLNKNSYLHEELRSLFNKGQALFQKKLAEKIKTAGNISYLALSGVFTGNDKANTDLMVIGSFDKRAVQEAVKNFEKEIGKSINYTIMDLKEYRLRKDIADRFLCDILEDKDKIVLVNDLKVLEEI